MNRFWVNALSDAAATGLGLLAQLALILALPRFLTIEGFAAYATAAATVGVSEMASDFGARLWAIRRFGAARHEYAETLVRSLLAKLVFSGGLALAILAAPWKTLSHFDVLLAFSVAVTQPSTDPLLWYLRGRNRIYIEARITLIWRLATAASILFLAWFAGSVTILLLTWLILNFGRIASECKFGPEVPARTHLIAQLRIVSWSGLWTTITECVPLGLALLTLSLFQRLGVLGLSFLGTSEDVAFFGLAFTLVSSSGFLATSITISSFPALAEHLETGHLAAAEEIVRRKLRLIGITISPICIVGLLVAPIFIKLAYPTVYLPAAEVLIWLFPGVLVSSLNLGMKYLMTALHLNWADAACACVGVVSFVLLAPLPFWPSKPLGAAFAWCAGEFMMFVTRSYVLYKERALPSGFFWRCCLAFLFLWSTSVTLSPTILTLL